MDRLIDPNLEEVKGEHTPGDYSAPSVCNAHLPTSLLCSPHLNPCHLNKSCSNYLYALVKCVSQNSSKMIGTDGSLLMCMVKRAVEQLASELRP